MTLNCSIGEGRLGILGGMGSEATAYFLRTLAQRSQATSDQEHIPFVLLSCPEIPDRSSAMEAGTVDVPSIIRSRLEQLEDAGCGAVAIPCNTAHYWRRDFASSLQIPLIDMVSATAQHAARLGARSAIVLGTRSTMKHRLYGDSLEKLCIRLMDVEEATIRATGCAIALAKSGDPDSSWKQLAHALHACRALHPDVIILGCTELPMVVPPGTMAVDLVDSDACLADACVRWWQSLSTGVEEPDIQFSEEIANEP
ncbi:aspartate/glutamate racemase family protein [Paraburkholderia sabiae]|uniref:Amino acid racemase n=1 Tax=Paraburkholderia sabiae TaxID=273251 RepID=A0ABU9QL22_9BURK|nr:amino acid racemase [Paraburkholderia sabiae]WJZ77376.1 amino acid racemase [Paraburkholderia sabiae]CAD6547548.1 Aspartate racemase [Paraburkholderia sabiae]